MTPEEIRNQLDRSSAQKIHQHLYKIYTENNPLKKVVGLIKKGGNHNLSKQNAALGLLFLNGFTEYIDADNSKGRTAIEKKDKRFVAFKTKYNLDKLWDEEHYKLLVFLFGKQRAPYIRHAWNNTHKLMYQEDYNRRSFRRPNDKDTVYVNQINFIVSLIHYATMHKFSLQEAISYDNHLQTYGPVAKVWAAAIDAGDEPIYKHMIGILDGEVEKGTVSRNIIKALLLSEKPEAWKKVGDLLLAAQRQEGLRQTILECLDETSKGAFSYILNLIIENNLIRFSSVVRALDVWAGFGWEAEKQSTVKRFIELAQQFFNQPELIETTIKSKDNAEVYMSLWGLAVHDVDLCYPHLKWLFEKGNIEKKGLALYFIAQANIDEWNKEFSILAISEKERYLQFFGIELLKEEKLINETLFRQLLDIYQSFSKKEYHLKEKVFSWLNFTFKRASVGEKLIQSIDINDDTQLNILFDLFPTMDIENRESFVQKMLPGFARYYFDKDTPTEKPTNKQRDFALKLLKDRSTYIKDAAINALKNSHITEEEIQLFEDLLTRKSASFRTFVLEMILKQTDNQILQSATRLTTKKNLEQRLAGLDLLNHLFKNDKHELVVKELAEKYLENNKIGSKEQILLDNLLTQKAPEYTSENGYGLYNPQNISTLQPLTPPTKGEFINRINGKHSYGLSMPLSKVESTLNDLKNIFISHKEFEYEIENYNGVKTQVLLGQTIDGFKRKEEDWTNRQKFENFPLYHVWENWYEASN